MTETVTLKHILTGHVAEYPAHYLRRGLFSDVLVPTDEEAQCVDCVVPEPEFVDEEDVVPTPSEVFGNYTDTFDTEDDA